MYDDLHNKGFIVLEECFKDETLFEHIKNLNLPLKIDVDGVWEINNEHGADIADTQLALDLHTDACWLDQNKYPDYSCLYWLNVSEGGETIISDIKKAFDLLTKEQQQILKDTPVKYQWGDYNTKETSEYVGPLYSFYHSQDRFRINLHWNMEKSWQTAKPLKNMIEWMEANMKLTTLLLKNRIVIKMKEGNLLIINNNYMAHGRKKFYDPTRKVRGCWLHLTN